MSPQSKLDWGVADRSYWKAVHTHIFMWLEDQLVECLPSGWHLQGPKVGSNYFYLHKIDQDGVFDYLVQFDPALDLDRSYAEDLVDEAVKAYDASRAGREILPGHKFNVTGADHAMQQGEAEIPVKQIKPKRIEKKT